VDKAHKTSISAVREFDIPGTGRNPHKVSDLALVNWKRALYQEKVAGVAWHNRPRRRKRLSRAFAGAPLCGVAAESRARFFDTHLRMT